MKWIVVHFYYAIKGETIVVRILTFLYMLCRLLSLYCSHTFNAHIFHNAHIVLPSPPHDRKGFQQGKGCCPRFHRWEMAGPAAPAHRWTPKPILFPPAHSAPGFLNNSQTSSVTALRNQHRPWNAACGVCEGEWQDREAPGNHVVRSSGAVS